MALAIEGFFPAMALRFSDSAVWRFLGAQFSHVAWQGLAFWDLIQPSFLFVVGVALPYSIASRRARGASGSQIALHVLWRALVLVLLGLLIASDGFKQTNFSFLDTLSQIGLAYPFAALLVGKRPNVQILVGSAILVAYWFAFYLYPLPSPGFDYASVGVAQGGEPYRGLFAHWNKNTNFAWAFDRWFLNLFPRADEFHHSLKGLQTLNFFPSIVTMVCGVMAGELLRGPVSPGGKLKRLSLAGLICFALGALFGATLCPIVKSIWTPSWTLFSAGIVLWLLAAFYWIVDMRGWKSPAFPLVVVGMNSTAMYCMLILFKPWLWKTMETHFGGQPWSLQFIAIVFILWLICFWMYRRRLFIRI